MANLRPSAVATLRAPTSSIIGIKEKVLILMFLGI